MKNQQVKHCPSMHPEYAKDGKVFGEVSIENGTVATSYFDEARDIDMDFVKNSSPQQLSREYRISGQCQQSSCNNWENEQCGLVARITKNVPKGVKGVANCPIRSNCLWVQQEGKAACFTCSSWVHNLRKKLIIKTKV